MRAARAHKKCIASACAPADLPFWLSLDIDLLFLTNDIACLKKAAADTLAEARSILHAKPPTAVPHAQPATVVNLD